jgi:NAD+ synthase
MNTTAIVEHIVNWLKDYAENAGTKGFVVGVSGGIDSAVTSSLAARTGLPTLCVEMPIHQPADQVTRAAEHIDYLQQQFPNVKRQEVELTPIFDAFIDALPEAQGDQREMALVNSRARLRMTTLYYFAGLHGYLVAGTGNKVEDFGVGFYTKYGDGGVDLSPIADLNKTEVYALGKEMGVIERIMQAPPTDGLWGDDRTDEDQIGASYPELEWAMDFQASGQDATVLEGRQREVYEIYMRLHRANRHKMEPIPVCAIPPHLKD